MEFPGLDEQRTGILIAVSSLRSKESRGIGEFYDLKKLADWCSDQGISLIQILPVNDSGVQTSPYSALSAFALHPVYLSIESIPEYPSKGVDVLAEIPRTADLSEPVAFADVVRAKEAALDEIYQANRDRIAASTEIAHWVEANAWVKTYSVFRALRLEYRGTASMDWPEHHRSGEQRLVDELWRDGAGLSHEPYFFAWLQYRLEQQLVQTSRYLESRGVYLKGDLPILMNEDSADVWANPRIFNRRLRAGAPPDMFSELGQNWDFPIYDWDYLAETEFAWWKSRLLAADKYYHAYRIDHVLGFFRIWAIPAASYSGTLGYFVPSRYLDSEMMRQRGFDDGRVTWLAEPHVRGSVLRSTFGAKCDDIVERAFSNIGDEDLYGFKPSISGERHIQALDVDDDHTQALLDLYRDRALIRVDEDAYYPAWVYRECSRFKDMSEDEKRTFEDLAAESAEISESMWERQGRRLLSFMSSTATMLTCAEDLGVVPRSVPKVLENLGILGLRIPRWTRHYGRPEEPYFAPEEYPRLTICATSVHDTSTLRGWWLDEADRDAYWSSLGLDGPAPDSFSPEVAQTIYEALSGVRSAILLFQIQDLFDLDSDLRRASPQEDRVNVPGTIAESNWAYRWPVALEELPRSRELNERLHAVVEKRRSENGA